MNSEQNLTREEAIAILNTPDEQLNELIERAGTACRSADRCDASKAI